MNNSEVLILNQRCPCCNNQGYLELFTCSNCNKTIARCDLVFTIFIDPLNISMNKTSDNAGNSCVYCNQPGTLIISKENEIIKLGLSNKDYKYYD